ncbi:hypothetical protein AWX17_19540 [Priestia megaterium]|nr:hypothetical protein AWX17_19540 [Priestia megaterium]
MTKESVSIAPSVDKACNLSEEACTLSPINKLPPKGSDRKAIMSKKKKFGTFAMERAVTIAIPL